MKSSQVSVGNGCTKFLCSQHEVMWEPATPDSSYIFSTLFLGGRTAEAKKLLIATGFVFVAKSITLILHCTADKSQLHQQILSYKTNIHLNSNIHTLFLVPPF